MGLEFTTPPPEKKGQRSQYWIDVVRELKANPNEWAKVGNYSPGVATHIRRGKYPAFVEGNLSEDQLAIYMRQNWQVTTRKTDDGKRNDIWIRWIG